MTVKDYLAEYYGSYNEDGRLCSMRGSVEFLTTMRYIEKYIGPGMKIIEIGAGTGRYTHALAQKGYSVDAVELLEHNIEIFRQNTVFGENVSITQGNAVELADFSDNTYDITLLLGPMYHLFTKEDKLRALSEALRVTKQNGILFVAYCIADASILGYGFKEGHIFELIEKGMLDTTHFKARSNPWDLFELYRKEDIDELMCGFDAERLHYVASDGYTNHMSETLDNMDERTFEIYIKYHLHICERADMVGLTNHALDVVRKN